MRCKVLLRVVPGRTGSAQTKQFTRPWAVCALENTTVMIDRETEAYLASQFAWLRDGRSLYVEWESRRGQFYGCLLPRASGFKTRFKLVGKLQSRLLPRVNRSKTFSGSPPVLDIRGTLFDDDRSLITFLKLNLLERRIWDYMAHLRSGRRLGVAWGGGEDRWADPVGSGSLYFYENEVVYRGSENTSPADCMNPAQDFEYHYRVGEPEGDHSLACLLRRLPL